MLQTQTVCRERENQTSIRIPTPVKEESEDSSLEELDSLDRTDRIATPINGILIPWNGWYLISNENELE